MGKPGKIAAYIRETFQLYGLDYTDYFSDYSEEDAVVELPMIADGKLDMALVEQAATVLGVPVRALLEMNDCVVDRWYKKFSYFSYQKGFKHAYDKSFHDDNYDAQRLIEILFEKPYVPQYPTRYDYNEVYRRLLALLREYDDSLPGTYHQGAHIARLEVITDNFCHYDKIELLVGSYLDMVHRYKQLFSMTWDAGLLQEEIEEYNFLATVLGAYDRVYGKQHTLYYHLLRSFIPIYRQEGYQGIDAFVRFDPNRVPKPWRCAEFACNRDLVCRFVEEFPDAKKEMREFATHTAQFYCSFVWTDEPLPPCMPREDRFKMSLSVMLGEEPRSYYHILLVPKTDEEMRGDGEYAAMLQKLAGPVKLGGVPVKAPPDDESNKWTVYRAQARVSAAHSGKGGVRHES